MYSSRLRRLAAACRHALPFFLTFVLAGPAAAAQHEVHGTVVDQSGRPLPRAYVRALDRSSIEIAGTFTDEAGRFRLAVTVDDCRVEASLTGFEPAAVPCGTGASLRVALPVAPIHETVVVTATRTEAPAGQVGASVTAFTAEDLARRQSPLVVDLLRNSPGVAVVRTGGPGTVTSLFVRGGESNYNKVLLDGIPLNEPGGTFNFSNLTTDNLERVEIVRGAQSALFGSDAMASVVQLLTKRPDHADNRPHSKRLRRRRTYDTLHANAGVSGAAGRLDYTLGAARLTTDNRAPNNAFENTTLSANVGVAVSDTATVRFIGRGEPGTRRHTGSDRIRPARPRRVLPAPRRRCGTLVRSAGDADVPSARDVLAVDLELSVNQPRARSAVHAAVRRTGRAVSVFRFRLRQPYGSAAPSTRAIQADWRLSSDASHGDQRLTMLVDWNGERAVLKDALASTQTPASRDNLGWSIQHQALWRRVFVTAGARVEHNDSFGTAAVPRGSIVLVAHESSGAVGETKLKANAGLGIKEPTVLQSFSLSPFFLGNPALQPERARTAEVGVEQRLAADRVRSKRRGSTTSSGT